MSEKATPEQTTQFIKEIEALDKAADKDSSKFSDWELAYVDEQGDRVEEFGQKVFVSVKQVETTHNIYRKIILGEDTRPANGEGKPLKKRNRAASRQSE